MYSARVNLCVAMHFSVSVLTTCVLTSSLQFMSYLGRIFGNLRRYDGWALVVCALDATVSSAASLLNDHRVLASVQGELCIYTQFQNMDS